jgi:neutral ceramidase
LFQAAGGVIKEAPEWLQQCQTKVKAPLLVPGLMEPVPWTPDILPVQVVKIGQYAIAAVAFEVSTMAGRRIRDTLRATFGTAVKDVEVASISNGYAQYLTTREEYSKQNYEGASTLFGPNQLEAVQQELARVATSIVKPSVELTVGPTPRQFDRFKLLNFQTGVVMDAAPFLRSFGSVRANVKSTYSIGETVSVSFAGGHPKNQLQQVKSFCDIEKETNGRFTTYMTDSHWDLRYRWFREGAAESRNVCEWHLRPGRPTSTPGRYRIRHRGFSKSLLGQFKAYEGVSSVFEVRNA